MIALAGYQIHNQIYESENSLVYRAVRGRQQQPVILKVLKEDYPNPAELTRYKQEFEITRNLNVEGAIRAYGLESFRKTLVIVLEDFGGISIRQWLQGKMGLGTGTLSVAEILKLGIKITIGLGNIHSAHVIHKDINPANIVVNPETGEVKIIDFGISTLLDTVSTNLAHPSILEGTLGYISPEQTGRMNRRLDYRSDFYSLGVTLYELLTGRLPFEGSDAMELVHSHLAKKPVPCHAANSAVPKTVSGIVAKLMAKTAEERYKSAWGIKSDLEICLNQLETTGEIEVFSLAGQDRSEKFQIPEKLYGREREVQELLNAFDRIADSQQESTVSETEAAKGGNRLTFYNQRGPKSKKEMMLVAGYSGIGENRTRPRAL